MSSGKRRDDVLIVLYTCCSVTTGRTWTALTAGPRRSCVSIYTSLENVSVDDDYQGNVSRTTLQVLSRGGGGVVLRYWWWT